VKSIVIYFSLTGNTRKVAHAVHNGVNQRVERCDISTFKKAEKSRLVEYDLLIFGSPVWDGVPPNVMRFIDTIPSLKKKHCAVFCTHGASPEGFFPLIIGGLEKKGLSVIGFKDWYGSVYRPAAPTRYLTDGHPDEIDLEEAEEFGKEIAELSQKIYNGKMKLGTAMLKMEIAPRASLNKPAPRLNTKKCRYPSCSLCMSYCPVGAINLSVSPHIFARGCSFCYFCEMICPEGAVEVDYSAYAEAFRQHARDKFEKVLEKAEKEGTFRRLVPLDKIGWDTPYYMVHSKHPRYIIPDEDID
jgi:flavodoxin/formate hydrogenlyase subunit 6/NADH:ubiquinone oxidoreductase subunit I